MRQLLILPLVGLCVGCSTIRPESKTPIPVVTHRSAVHASWYQHGAVTASGQKFNPHGLTAAHKTLPFGTKVRVTNPKNGQSVIVVINDRGPFIKGRGIDLSLGAARKIDMVSSGIAVVEIEILS